MSPTFFVSTYLPASKSQRSQFDINKSYIVTLLSLVTKQLTKLIKLCKLFEKT